VDREPRREPRGSSYLIVVDTSVWLDFFRGARTAHVDRLFEFLERDLVAITDLVLTEILQGVRENRVGRRVQHRLGVLATFRLEALDDFHRAAALYRRARDRGLTVRRTVDCLIASVCIRERLPILHNDADFDRLAACTELEVVGSL
jgi:predicted nucleic acid-binding protein